MWIDFCRWVSESTTDKSLHTNHDLDSHINGRYRSVFGIPQPKKLKVSAFPFQNTQSDIQYFFFAKSHHQLYYPPSLEKEGIPKSSLIWLSSNMQNINDDIGIPSHIQTKFLVSTCHMSPINIVVVIYHTLQQTNLVKTNIVAFFDWELKEDA